MGARATAEPDLIAQRAGPHLKCACSFDGKVRAGAGMPEPFLEGVTVFIQSIEVVTVFIEGVTVFRIASHRIDFIHHL